MLLLIIMIYIDRFHFRNYDVTIRFFFYPSLFMYFRFAIESSPPPRPTLQSHFNIFHIETRQNGHSKLPLQCEKLWGIWNTQHHLVAS
jgi:hypothetical protein